MKSSWRRWLRPPDWPENSVANDERLEVRCLRPCKFDLVDVLHAGKAPFDVLWRATAGLRPNNERPFGGEFFRANPWRFPGRQLHHRRCFGSVEGNDARHGHIANDNPQRAPRRSVPHLLQLPRDLRPQKGQGGFSSRHSGATQQPHRSMNTSFKREGIRMPLMTRDVSRPFSFCRS